MSKRGYRKQLSHKKKLSSWSAFMSLYLISSIRTAVVAAMFLSLSLFSLLTFPSVQKKSLAAHRTAKNYTFFRSNFTHSNCSTDIWRGCTLSRSSVFRRRREHLLATETHTNTYSKFLFIHFHFFSLHLDPNERKSEKIFSFYSVNSLSHAKFHVWGMTIDEETFCVVSLTLKK